MSEGDTALSRRTQQLAVPLKRDDCPSHRTEWAGWASVSHPVAAGLLFLGIAQNGLGWLGYCAPATAGGLFLAVAQNGAGLGWAGLAGLQRWQLGAAQFFQGPAAAA